jgi:hypothetical protein
MLEPPLILHSKEVDLIRTIREMGWGRILILVQDHLPQMIEEAFKQRRLH